MSNIQNDASKKKLHFFSRSHSYFLICSNEWIINLIRMRDSSTFRTGRRGLDVSLIFMDVPSQTEIRCSKIEAGNIYLFSLREAEGFANENWNEPSCNAKLAAITWLFALSLLRTQSIHAKLPRGVLVFKVSGGTWRVMLCMCLYITGL